MELVLDELTDNDQNVSKYNEVNVVYDSKLQSYLEMNSLIIDYDQDLSQSGFFIQRNKGCC
jgi:Fe-S cluster assembly iron-binding protein IscA